MGAGWVPGWEGASAPTTRSPHQASDARPVGTQRRAGVREGARGAPASSLPGERPRAPAEGWRCPSGPPKGAAPFLHLPLPLWRRESGFSFRMCVGGGFWGGWLWHCCSNPSPEMAGLGSHLDLRGTSDSHPQIFSHRRLGPGGLSFQVCLKPCEHPLSQSSQVNPSLVSPPPWSNLGTSPSPTRCRAASTSYIFKRVHACVTHKYRITYM